MSCSGAFRPGVGEEGDLKLTPEKLDEVLRGGAQWAVRHGYGTAADLEFVEEQGCVEGAVPENVSLLAKKRQRGEMGTLGSGNHYLEVQVVDRIYDRAAAEAFGLRQGQVVVSIHCGSRGLGHQIGTDYLVSLAKAASRLGIELPDRELACAPINSPEGQQYIGAMNAAINCALANRQILAHLTREAFARVLPQADLETLFDISHNTCKVERHVVDGREMLLYVHRKGATRAFGPGHPAVPPALSRDGPAGDHRRQHGHRFLCAVRDERKRAAGVQFGEPRRGPRDEPPSGAQTMERPATHRRAGGARHPDPHALDARRCGRSARRLQGRRPGGGGDGTGRSGAPRRISPSKGLHQGITHRFCGHTLTAPLIWIKGGACGRSYHGTENVESA